MFGRRLRKLLFLTLILYFLYLVIYGCASISPELNVLAQITCAHLNKLVYPFINRCTPVLAEWDEKMGISRSVAPVWQSAIDKWEAVDDSYQVKNNVVLFINKSLEVSSQATTLIAHYYEKASAYYFFKLHPTVCFYSGKYKLYLEYVVDNVVTAVRRYSWYSMKKVQIWTRFIVDTKICPFVTKSMTIISNNPQVSQVVEQLHLRYLANELSVLYSKLKSKSAKINKAVQEKTEFLRDEFGALDKFKNLRKSIKRNTKKNIQMILDLTNDFTGLKKQIIDQVESDSEHEGAESDYSDEEDTTITLTKTLTETLQQSKQASMTVQSSSSSITQNSSSVSLTLVPENELTNSSASLEEFSPQTLKEFNITDTITKSPHFAASNDNIVSFGSSSLAQVKYELDLWEDKIKTTLELAENSLTSDFEPYLKKKLDEFKELFSANFTKLQSDNYKRYKVMGELIAAIDKDSEYMRTHDEIIEEPEVDRQIMRDKIKEARDTVELEMKYADETLNKAHAEVLTAYFDVAQTTVDILESYAETTILDFSTRLKTLIEYLKQNEDFDDKISWTAWKKFHQVKESIFQIRDKIFDEAHAYKDDLQASKKPKALKEWDEYVRNINFHIGFLVRDNDEYLLLVRAQANVAYQQREGLAYELTEKRAAEKAAAEEAAKRAAEEKKIQEEIDRQRSTEELERRMIEEELERQRIEAESIAMRQVEEEELAERERVEQEKKEWKAQQELNLIEQLQLNINLQKDKEQESDQAQELQVEENTTVSELVSNETKPQTHSEPIKDPAQTFSQSQESLSILTASQMTADHEIPSSAEFSEIARAELTSTFVESQKTSVTANVDLESVYEPSEKDEDYESEDIEAH